MQDRRACLWTGCVSLLLATGLTSLFWPELWQGGGLIGGDTYSYFFPQKVYFADAWREGRLPLWNPLVGHGYPILGESQTGALYPVNLILYRITDVNTAYHAGQLLHLILAHVGMTLLALQMGLSGPGACLAATVYVFGWLPPRMCLEWAAIGAAYLPWMLYCLEGWLRSGRRGWLFPLAWLLGSHLLAGHYNLAFINLLVGTTWVVARTWLTPETLAPGDTHAEASASEGDLPPRQRVTFVQGTRRVAWVLLMWGAGFALAAPQVAATWELKQLSQRADVGAAHEPGYGHIPPLYLLQVVAPWMWYPPDIDFDLVVRQLAWGAYPAATNRVEAHLYFGLVPLVLAVLAMSRLLHEEPDRRRPWLMLILLAAVATVYCTGWLLPLTRHLPGFSFFMGPGRYGVVTTFVVALLAGKELSDRWGTPADRTGQKRSRTVWGRRLVTLVVFAATIGDLWLVSRWVFYAETVSRPPLAWRDESVLREWSQRLGPQARLFAPGPNLPTLSGFAATPPYLGLSPAEYFDPTLRPPYPDVREVPPAEIERQVAWLRWAGVTHLLCQEPLAVSQWPVVLVWEGFDELINRAWGRYHEPLYLYELQDAPGRVIVELQGPSSPDMDRESAEDSSQDETVPSDRVESFVLSGPRIVLDAGDVVEIEVETAGPSRLVLKDLWYPGWDVSVDGVAAESQLVDGMFRGVEVTGGQHVVRWMYRSQRVRQGAWISLLAALGCGVFPALSVFRRRERV